MGVDIDWYIDELRHTVLVAGDNYEIWWAFKSKDTRPVFVDVMNTYLEFFQPAIHAHFVALVVALYRLYERRKDTINIPFLLRVLRREQHLPEAALNEFETFVEKEVKPTWKKVGILRHNVIAHQSAADPTGEFWHKAGLSPNELRDLLDSTEGLLNKLAYAINRNTYTFRTRRQARNHALDLLRDLKAIHQG